MNVWFKRAHSLVRFHWNCKACGEEYAEPDRRSYRDGLCESCAARNRVEGAYAISRVLCAVNGGRLTRAREHSCVDCGKQAQAWDHRDYTKPLEVEPVCKSCNTKRGRAYDSFWRPEHFPTVPAPPSAAIGRLDEPSCN